MASAVVTLVFGATPALAAGTQGFGTCTIGDDCVAAAGHASVSVTGTLTINEERAISFGNLAVTTPGGTSDTVVLSVGGVRTKTGAFTLLHGASGGGTTGANADTGGESPGHYTIQGGQEDAGSATQVYISFADTNGNPIDMCTPAGVCDAYHPGNHIAMNPPAAGQANDLEIDSFVINESGNDAYGHYITNNGTVPAPGISNPFGVTTHTALTQAAGIADVVVGATLRGGGSGSALSVGKYTGTFEIMASY
jgi:hypothetical protein